MPTPYDTGFPQADPGWIEEQYLLWKEDARKVPPQWHYFFLGFDLSRGTSAPSPGHDALLKNSGVQSLIYAYRDIGHLLACTDPLSPCPLSHPLLDLERFGLDESDLDRTFVTRRFLKEEATLREIVETLRATYCGAIGVEFMHIQNPEERQWLIERMEPVRNAPSLGPDDKLRIHRRLQEGARFEEFLHRKFPAQKRFSLEGGESLIPLLDFVIDRAAANGCTDLVMGMAHRGRLNVLANIFGKPYENIFAEFRDDLQMTGDGDVKYHKGYSADLELQGKRVHLTIAPNPSHLEAVDPVVEGKARARQDRLTDAAGARVLPLLVHGDAAFAGQGVVAEVLNLSQLEGYRTGGTLHVVINNQIGFTTRPADARSSCYATDLAKTVSAPVFHVHGDDPEGVVHAGLLAADYRQRFGKDVVVEIVCYRRHGHNEGDEPAFTQPLMYGKIAARDPVHHLYARTLEGEGVSSAELERVAERVTLRLEEAFAAPAKEVDVPFAGAWQGLAREYTLAAVETAVEQTVLRELAARISLLPEGHTPHPKLAALLARRRESVERGEGIDWGTAETLAYATLLHEGVSVRLSGQDSRRGTFNHRHSTIYDTASERPYVPLTAACGGQARFMVYDSSLSEQGVLGFEFGYSLESPQTLVIWEAQFGDFANGAQVIIDQFIAAAETKWQRVSGLTMFLPHGYEGNGAEHSSGRIERFLQLCAGDNLQVVYPSTPAQMFHLLRRQVRQPFRKPLVVFTPKSLLRHPDCVSTLDDLSSGSFREVIGSPGETARTVLVSSGKVYFDLLERKVREGRDDVALVRLEQLYPLRSELLAEALRPFGRRAVYRWVQEEPRNMGAWSFLRDHLAEVLQEMPECVSRPEDAAPAVGSHRVHAEQQEELLRRAFA
ncbi:MAG TPA: 2-oxoglutarate dehydrogenase E1 component [Verrucomicrobiae bacterium]|nr:2-oxoglutarate dehydrogenase E1 component [Verrucomicrobiae bacterium]